MANIRDQDTWVHQGDHEAATAKAKDLVRMSVARVSLLEPLHKISFRPYQIGFGGRRRGGRYDGGLESGPTRDFRFIWWKKQISWVERP